MISLLLLAAAQAQETYSFDQGIDAHGLHIAAFDGDLQDGLLVERPSPGTRGAWFAGGLLEFAESPLRYTNASGAEVVLLDDLLTLNLAGGYSPIARLRLQAALPLYLTASGELQDVGGVGPGDLQLGVAYLIRVPEHGSLGLSVVPRIDLPTGDAARFLGDEGIGGGAKLALSKDLGRVALAGDLGAGLNAPVALDNVDGGVELLAGVSAGYQLQPTSALTLEGRTLVEPGTGAALEALASYRRGSARGTHLLVGGGAGFGSAVSAATWRLFVGGGFGARPEPVLVDPDPDRDGLVGEADACPDTPETMNGLADTDGCPDQLASLAVRALLNGAEVPAEIDVPGGTADRMPDTVATASATHQGCLSGKGEATLVAGPNALDIPLNRATGTIKVTVKAPDGPVAKARVEFQSANDACLLEQSVETGADGVASAPQGVGPYLVLVSAEGYGVARAEVTLAEGATLPIEVALRSALTRMETKQIVILEKVFFEHASATIKSESFALLDEVANVLLANSHVERVEVGGHTDTRGGVQYNVDLSQSRADSVRQYLIGKGVAAERLTARGYGEHKPIASNDTGRGQAENRRVEFQIVQGEPAPAAAP